MEPLLSLAEHAALVLRDISIRDDREESRKRREESERLQIEAEVQKLQAISIVAEELPVCVFVKDFDHRFTYVNRRFCEDVGMTAHEILGKTDFDVFGEEYAKLYRKQDLEVIQTGCVIEDASQPQPGLQGEKREVFVRKQPLVGSRGGTIGVIGVYWDVSEYNQGFRMYTSWMDGFVRSANAIVYAHDLEGVITFVNPAAENSFGYSNAEIAGMSLLDIAASDKDEDRIRKTIDSHANARNDSHPNPIHSFSVRAKDGRVLDLETAVSQCKIQEDRQGILGVAHDVTERNQARVQLAIELERTRRLRDVASGLGRAGEVSAVHRLVMLAVTHHECLGFSRAILFLPTDQPEVFAATLAVGPTSKESAQEQWGEAGGVPFDEAIQICLGSEVRKRSGDLSSRIEELVLDLREEKTVASVLIAGRQVVQRQMGPSVLQSPRFAAVTSVDEPGESILAPLRGESDLKGIIWADRAFLAERRIPDRTAQQLDVLGNETGAMVSMMRYRQQAENLAHNIAREMCYALMTRAGVLEFQLANLKWALNEEHEPAIRKMHSAIEFFKNSAVLAMKDWRLMEARNEDAENLDFNRIARDVVDQRHDGRVAANFAETELLVRINRTHMEDIVLELLTNALEFVDEHNGRVEVETKAEGQFARLDIADDGPGIHPSVRAKMYERFVRYPEGRMGMGLAYVKSLVETYDGTIKEIGSVGRGAHFVVKIPLAPH